MVYYFLFKLDSGATDSTGLASSSGSNQDVSDCPGVALSKMTRNVVWIFLIDGNLAFYASGFPKYAVAYYQLTFDLL